MTARPTGEVCGCEKGPRRLRPALAGPRWPAAEVPSLPEPSAPRRRTGPACKRPCRRASPPGEERPGRGPDGGAHRQRREPAALLVAAAAPRPGETGTPRAGARVLRIRARNGPVDARGVARSLPPSRRARSLLPRDRAAPRHRRRSRRPASPPGPRADPVEGGWPGAPWTGGGRPLRQRREAAEPPPRCLRTPVTEPPLQRAFRFP